MVRRPLAERQRNRALLELRYGGVVAFVAEIEAWVVATARERATTFLLLSDSNHPAAGW